MRVKKVKQVIQVFESAFASGKIGLRIIQNDTPLVTCEVHSLTSRLMYTATVQNDHYGLMMQEAVHNPLGQFIDWNELDFYKAESQTDMVGWVSWASTHAGVPIPIPEDLGQKHLLPELARLCWSHGRIETQVKGDLIFDLTGALWREPQEIPNWDIRFHRPGNPLGHVGPGIQIPSAVIVRIESAARAILDHLNQVPGTGNRIPTVRPETLRNLGEVIARRQMTSQSLSRVHNLTVHPTISQAFIKLMQGSPGLRGGGSIKDFMDMSNQVQLLANPAMPPDLVLIYFEDGTSLTYQLGRGEVINGSVNP